MRTLAIAHHPLMIRLAVKAFWKMCIKVSAKPFMQQLRNLFSDLSKTDARFVVDNNLVRAFASICFSVDGNTAVSINRTGKIANRWFHLVIISQVEKQMDKVRTIPDDLMIREFPR